ncbi:hypothetical protein, partial [Thermoactinomyces sp. CICC 10521]|uniref:hypothetical protein n=1 Tax=Thermoactinomyces sp. CICC 10521 TaxID=2767426 RepID=UPI001E49E101
ARIKLSDKDLAQKESTGHASLFSFQGTHRNSFSQPRFAATIYILSNRKASVKNFFSRTSISQKRQKII